MTEIVVIIHVRGTNESYYSLLVLVVGLSSTQVHLSHKIEGEKKKAMMIVLKYTVRLLSGTMKRRRNKKKILKMLQQ